MTAEGKDPQVTTGTEPATPGNNPRSNKNKEAKKMNTKIDNGSGLNMNYVIIAIAIVIVGGMVAFALRDSNVTTAQAPAVQNQAATPEGVTLTPEQLAKASTVAQQMVKDGTLSVEQAANPDVINQIANAILADTVVIDDTASDSTADVVRRLQENFTPLGERTEELLFAFYDASQPASNYDDILFEPENKTLKIAIKEGEVLYLSAGIYNVKAPNGEIYERRFGEEIVANDYYTLPGVYIISNYPVPTTKERGKFAAIGGRIVKAARPGMYAELQGQFEAPFDFHPLVGENGYRHASQMGRAKKASFSRFVTPEGVFETKTVLKAGKLIVTLTGDKMPAKLTAITDNTAVAKK